MKVWFMASEGATATPKKKSVTGHTHKNKARLTHSKKCESIIDSIYTKQPGFFPVLTWLYLKVVDESIPRLAINNSTPRYPKMCHG